jgi:hypothetical protein
MRANTTAFQNNNMLCAAPFHGFPDITKNAQSAGKTYLYVLAAHVENLIQTSITQFVKV